MTVRDTPAKRNRRVRIEEPTEVTDTDTGKTTRTWLMVGRAWVMIGPLEGREYWEAQQQESSITHQVTGTWEEFKNVTADFRLVLEGRTFNLLGPPRNQQEAGVLAVMMVEEVTR